MHIQVKTITGRCVDLSVEKETEILSLYQMVQSLTGVPVEEQKLINNGKVLSSGSVFDNQLEDNSQVYLVVALEGGAKGKKKKKDTKKGKNKHKKKKVKLAILKYYKVEGGKVVRLRQMCKVCPPGTFIAEHADRLYCGRCHTAYQKVGGADKKGAAGAKDAAKAKGKK
jgi:small subunit ribosomal protein S27Ae